MRFSFWPAANQSWSELLDMARHIEASGWDGFWVADHFMPDGEDVSEPCHEVWALLAAVAVAVPRVRIGPMVACNSYRHPAVHAKIAATIDHISGGRLVFGVGSGWQENEHRAYGIEFSTVIGRLRRLEEACQIFKGLFTQPSFTFAGKYYRLEDAPLEPKPLQSPLPLLIGGGGEKVTLRITARYADEWNVWGDVATLKHKMGVLDRHCREVGRDPDAIQRSAAVSLQLSEDRAANEARRRSAHYQMMAGTVEELRDTVSAYADAGVDELIIADFEMGPMAEKMAMIDRFIEEVAPVVR